MAIYSQLSIANLTFFGYLQINQIFFIDVDLIFEYLMNILI